MDFKIDFGPWETIFNGDFMKHQTQILVNPEKFFLIVIYEKDATGNEIGAVFQGYKAMVAKGNIDSFITTIPKPILGITKSNGEQTKKMIFISFSPIYVNFKQEDFIRKVDNSIKKSYNEIDNVIELARSSGIKIEDTTVAREEDYAPILSDPMIARLLISGLRKSSLELVDLPTKKIEETDNAIQLGLNKKREIIKEETKNLYRTIISGENKISLNYATYIINENLLLDNNATIIFDEDDYFTGIGNASKNEDSLKENLVEYEPAGFPTKKFVVKKDIKVSLKSCDFNLILKLFNTNDIELEKIFLENKFEFNTPKEIIENLNNIKYLNDFQKLKIERLLNIFDNNFSDFFGNEIDTFELTKKWSDKIGRSSIINMNDLNNLERIIFVDYFLNLVKVKNETIEKVILIIPNIDNILEAQKEKFLSQISLLENRGFGFLVGSKKMPFEFKEITTTQINIVNGNDVAVLTKGNRSYRVNLRPSLSGNIKY